MLEHLVSLILVLASTEMPLETPKSEAYQDGAKTLASIIIETGSEGALVSPDVDAALLSSVAWFESRYRPDSPDGDCREIGLSPSTVRICNAVGPMQLAKAAGQYLGGVDPSLRGIHTPELRDPKTNVRAGYAALKLWKATCGRTPAVWLTAYVWGRCPRSPDWEGVRRCALATAFLDKLGRKPVGWACGHEARIVDGHTRYLIRKLRRWTSPSASSPVTAPRTTAPTR